MFEVFCIFPTSILMPNTLQMFYHMTNCLIGLRLPGKTFIHPQYSYPFWTSGWTPKPIEHLQPCNNSSAFLFWSWSYPFKPEDIQCSNEAFSFLLNYQQLYWILTPLATTALFLRFIPRCSRTLPSDWQILLICSPKYANFPEPSRPTQADFLTGLEACSGRNQMVKVT